MTQTRANRSVASMAGTGIERATMTSRERVELALAHMEPDRVPLDLGGSAVTGMHVNTVYPLRQALNLDPPGTPVKVAEPFQMLGEIAPDLIDALGVDVVGLGLPKNFFGFATRAGSRGRPSTARRCWCPRASTPSPRRTATSSCIPQGDTSVRAVARGCRRAASTSTPSSARSRSTTTSSNVDGQSGGVRRRSPTTISLTSARGRAAAAGTARPSSRNFGGTGFGDIALVPGHEAQAPQGHPRHRRSGT